MTETIREIAFDTETTGLEADNGDRIIEVGAVELLNHVPTGETFRMLVNPGRPVSEATVRITGITDDMLVDKPRFEDARIVDALMDFIGEATIVAHNASFDRGFLNMELKRLSLPPIAADRAIDTLMLARQRYPGAQASLDALCTRFGIDTSKRSLHGALLDAELLAEVYLELRGGRQPGLVLDASKTAAAAAAAVARPHRPARPHAPSPEELAAHKAFLEKLTDPIWKRGT